jgi:hypothetical protein
MTQITEKQLIESLSQLKEIKPRKEWAVLLKSQILAEPASVKDFGVAKVGFWDVVSSMLFQRKMAYSFAAVLLLIAGAFGLAKLLPNEVALQKQTASITAPATKVAQADPKVIAGIKNLNQALKSNPVHDAKAIQNIASSLKTLADVPGSNLTANPDMQDLYKTVVAQQILDLQKTSLTNDQKKILDDTVHLYNTGKYSDALEQILLINK